MIFDLLRSVAGTWSGYLYGAAICGVLELLLPAEKQSRWSWLRGMLFTFLSLAAAVAVTAATHAALDDFGLKPLFAWDLGGAIHSPNPLVMLAGYTLVPMLGLFLYDVNYYWFHRLQHTVPLLWRFHAIHHSIEELNAFNAYHHVSEYVWRIPLLTIPLSLLFSVSEPQVVIIGTILHAVGVLAHGNVRLNFGPLRYLLVEPRFHRIHHSIERQHWNRNYSFYFPVLDVLFGTAYFPHRDETPRTGLDYAREPKDLRSFLFPPKPPAVAAADQPQSSTAQPRLAASSRKRPCGLTATASSAHSNTGASVT
jgi:sterol desaturase/sphingolipid hydroxylase (fatty acid hydroxylase superfamily)